MPRNFVSDDEHKELALPSWTGLQKDRDIKQGERTVVIGSYISDKSYSCNTFSIMGSATIKGSLFVTSSASVTGKLKVHENAIFGDKATLQGRTSVGGSIFAAGDIVIKGSATINNALMSDGIISAHAKLSTPEVISRGTFISTNQLETASVRARKIVLTGRAEVESLVAEEIAIGDIDKGKALLPPNKQDTMVTRSATSLPGYIGSTIRRVLTPRRWRTSPVRIQIRGDIVARKVHLHNCVVHGNVFAEEVVREDNVVIRGEVSRLLQGHETKLLEQP